MALSGNGRALTVARVGAARLGATRLGFMPKDTMDGNTSTLYMWNMERGTPDKEAAGSDPTWTSQKS